MVLNQNSSADRLGLNPAGLTKWENHQYRKPQLSPNFFVERNVLLERCSYGLIFSNKGKTLYLESYELKMFFDRQVNRRLSTITQITKGKQKPFLHFEQASSTRQVFEAKKLRSCNSLGSLSKQETHVNLFQSIKNLFLLLGEFSQLISQDRPRLVTQVVYNFL